MPNGNFTGRWITELSADLELLQALQTILPTINTNKTTLGLSAQQVTDLTTLVNGLASQISAVTTAKLALKGVVDSKDTQKKAVRTAINNYAKQWRANQAIPDSLLEQLMVAPHNPGKTTTPPSTPTNVQWTASGEGVIKLSWSRNGNTSSTNFVIESRSSATGAWVPTAVTTKTKVDINAPVGTYIALRITAYRGDLQSNPTAPVVIWENGGGNSLRIAA